MSREALTTVVQRSISDPAFRRQLATEPTIALGAYDLTADEFSALRSRDAGRLTALGVDLRMSKVFTLDPGVLGSGSITSVEPRDVAPVWIGDYAQISTGVQSPDAIDRNLALSDDSTTSGGVQSPDAMDRNLALSDLSVHSGAVQSPDAIERNLSLSTGSVEPRDVAPTWIGDGSETPAVHTFSGDDNPGPVLGSNDDPGPQLHLLGSDFQQ